ncbi:uncharacterized protein F4812DRAFT_456577 [Daldinia caldariorum]|uniref:uncharacterized protein n=1 Tax=Daldinia caldariorum TaxID=326644 RepID=UPI0020080A74|nr:uncharacterized protein F4812DRAFT_456577 [Daldinia caldariorum]KAI1470568.1 hypothetical protein F4812DRAFT_456577 [Daldinia caldariorum]
MANLARRGSTTPQQWSSKESTGTGTPTGRQACEICRERKVRCDRAEPRCGRCTRLSLRCGYDNKRRSTRDDLPAQLSQLEDRLAKAEALLSMPRTHTIPTPPHIEKPPTPTMIDPTMIEISPSANQPNNAMEVDISLPCETSLPCLDGNDMDLFTNCNDYPESTSGLSLDWTQLSLPLLEPTVSPTALTPPHVSYPPHIMSSSSHEDEITTWDLAALHQNYFNFIYYYLPFLSKERFNAELSTNGSSPALRALSYAVALMGCTTSVQYGHLQNTYYTLARSYAEQCEREASEGGTASLNLFQALVFIIRFEIMDHKLTRAWLTLGRAVRMSKLMGLHQMDQNVKRDDSSLDMGLYLPPTDDPMLMEERRRSFWGLYIFESFVRMRTGMECDLGAAEGFGIYLPSPGLLTSDFVPSKMPYLGNLTADPCPELSSFAGCVLMMELAIKCFDHGRLAEYASTRNGFWDSHYNLVKVIEERFGMLHMHLNAKSIREDPIAFSLYMNLRGTEILFHEVAVKLVERQGFPLLAATESQKRSMAAAYKVASTMRLHWPSGQLDRDILNMQATFLAWPVVMAMKALGRELKCSTQIKSESTNCAVTSLRLLRAALDYIEEPGGYWHRCTTSIVAALQEWDDAGAFDSSDI